MATVMMKCGHAANAERVHKDGTRTPSCVICAGITPGANEIDDNPPPLEGRTARCSYYGSAPSQGGRRGPVCMCERPSSPSLAFFSREDGKPFDKFYCGCWGWD